MLRTLTVVLLAAGALALGGCSSDTPPPTNLCTGVAAPCVAFTAGVSTASQISSAMATAAANTTFVFGAGTFSFTNTLTLPKVNGLTITGAGIDQTILDFSGQVAGAGGILGADATNSITFSKFTIQNTKGDGIKLVGATGVTFDTVKVTWTDPDNTTHGSYALYPVQSSNILVQNCEVIGSRDAGIYVGQSSNIIVRNNKVTASVAGIEIEASSKADVYGNESTGNTGGILVFQLPGLQVKLTTDVRIYNNNVHDNNTLNFGDPSGTVYAIPAGTGVVVMASANVEVFGNTIANNRTAAYAVISYCLVVGQVDQTCGTAGDPLFNPFPSNVYAHNNTFTNNGYSPATSQADQTTNPLGFLLFGLQANGAFGTTGTANNPVPSLIWDGIAPIPPYDPPHTGVDPTNPLDYWIASNATTFVNLNFPLLIPGGNPANLDPTALQFDPTVFTAASAPAGFPLPPVVIPGVP